MSRTKKFKMTDLGPIPEDWEVERIAENALPLRNNTLAREAMCETSSGVGNVHYGDVLIKYDSVLDCTESCVPDLIDGELYCKDCLQDGDVVFADTAEDETVGKAVEITNILDRKIVAGLHTIAFRPREKFERGWLGYFVNSKTYHDQLLPLIVGTKVCSVSRSGVGQTFWARPTASEQRHIAAALSDADELIAALTELLEKKRNLKQGAMQQLLTGKRRLPGFKGKWVEIRLGSMCQMFSGGTPLSTERSYYGGCIPWVSISDISSAGKYIESTENQLTQKGFESSSVRWYPAGCLLFAMYASIGKCCISRNRITSSQAILGIFDFKGLDVEFLYYNLSSRTKELIALGQTGTQSNLSKKIVSEILVNPPVDVQEQRAIAEVLSDMDEEIAGIEVELEKAKNVKTGMMQQLLTGKVRLEVA